MVEKTIRRTEPKSMPSLFRFILVLAVLGGLGYGAMLALVAFVDPQPRDMSHTIPASKFTGK